MAGTTAQTKGDGALTMEGYDSEAPAVKRSVLFVGGPDAFDAESAARQAAERDGGFVPIGAVAARFLSHLRHDLAAQGLSELFAARDWPLHSRRGQGVGALVPHPGRPDVARALDGPHKQRPFDGPDLTRHDGPGRSTVEAGIYAPAAQASPGGKSARHTGSHSTISSRHDLDDVGIR